MRLLKQKELQQVSGGWGEMGHYGTVTNPNFGNHTFNNAYMGAVGGAVVGGYMGAAAGPAGMVIGAAVGAFDGAFYGTGSGLAWDGVDKLRVNTSQ